MEATYTIQVEPSQTQGKVTATSSDGHSLTTSTPLFSGARYWQQPELVNPHRALPSQC